MGNKQTKTKLLDDESMLLNDELNDIKKFEKYLQDGNEIGKKITNYNKVKIVKATYTDEYIAFLYKIDPRTGLVIEMITHRYYKNIKILYNDYKNNNCFNEYLDSINSINRLLKNNVNDNDLKIIENYFHKNSKDLLCLNIKISCKNKKYTISTDDFNKSYNTLKELFENMKNIKNKKKEFKEFIEKL
uniref:Uncharacterized protein n=1 Tax=viral metagenome TaxID=1070528 RepID=A0A6C0H764_9ZZZZ